MHRSENDLWQIVRIEPLFACKAMTFGNYVLAAWQ
jgi:hypothetical protein